MSGLPGKQTANRIPEKQRRRPSEAHLDWGMKHPAGGSASTLYFGCAGIFFNGIFWWSRAIPHKNRYQGSGIGREAETGTVYLAETNVLYVA
jgi:hypothetical protein